MTVDHDLTALLGSIRNRFESERGTLEQETSERIEKIRRESEAERTRLEKQMQNEVDERLRRERELRRVEANSVASERKLGIQHAILDEVFRSAEAILDDFMKTGSHGSERYDEVFSRLLLEAAAGVSGTGAKGTIEVHADQEQIAREALEANGFAMAVDSSAEKPGTIVARSSDGTRIVDNSLFRRLARARKRGVPDIVDLLFRAG